MRIDSSGSVSGAIGGNQGQASPQAAPTQSTVLALPQDTAIFSDSSLSVASLTSQALSMASDMESRVDALRAAVNSGQYALDPTEIATAMLNEGL